jgi:hypothetical protein
LPSVFDREFYSGKIKKLIKLVLSGKLYPLLKILKKRKFPHYLEPYAGDQWWALPIETVKKIIEFVDEHRDYSDYHKYSLAPDEMFFQTILMWFNKETKLFPHHQSTTYVRWIPVSKEFPKSLTPVTFTKSYLNELLSLPDNKLFARKFNSELDTEILNLLDSELSC